MSVCKGCAYNLGNTCQILISKQIESCFAKAGKEEAKKREKEIQEYKKRFDELVFPKKTVREKLDEKFLELYKDGCNDKKIAGILKVSPSSVGQYRKNLGLEVNYHNYKKKPAATGK